MAQLIVVAENHHQLEELMRPFDIELAVPHIRSFADILMNERDRLSRDLEREKKTYSSKDAFKKANKHRPNYVKHIAHDIETYLAQTREGVAALKDYVREEYGIKDEDLLPNNKFLRRFNPYAKWDYYEIKSIAKLSNMIDSIDESFIEGKHILLPNYLWIDEKESDIDLTERWDRIKALDDHYYFEVEFHN